MPGDVFVLGAGASAPYGFPTAQGLRENIIDRFSERFIQYTKTNMKAKLNRAEIDELSEVKEAQGFVETFRKSSISSIDKFLELNPQYSRYGKLAILFSILSAENASRFREETISGRQYDWLSYLLNRVAEGIAFGEDPITFITFNYDRSLEFFLHESLTNAFTQEAEIINRIREIMVMHVYGKIGNLDWQRTTRVLPYGHSFLDVAAEQFAANIKTIQEERSVKNDMPRTIDQADRVFFLGFGYRPENMVALGLVDENKRQRDTRPKFFCCTYEMSDRERQNIRDALHKEPNTGGDRGQVVLGAATWDCRKFLEECY